jgi:cation transport ATPase
VTVTAPADPAVPDHPDPEHLAAAGLAEWLREDRAAAEEHEEAMRAGMHRHEMRRRMEAADHTLAEARTRVSGLKDRHNLDGRRTLSFWLGSGVVAVLVVLDAIPLNWAAQAFGLNAADSWVVTFILLAASIGAMAALEAARHDSRRYLTLVAVTLTAYAGLVALRTSFLVTVTGDGMAAALLQAVVLSAISAGLVFLGSAVMTRTRPYRLSRAQARARRARQVSQASETAWRRAGDKLERHLGVLHRQLIRQPLYSSVPSGMTHTEWVDVLDRVLRAQFAQR